MFNEKDYEFMKMALKEAKIGFERGDLPVGAVLVIDGKLIGRTSNSARINGDYLYHAEFLLLQNFSGALKKKSKKSKATLYTTWEPCLHCLASSIMSRIDKIVYACKDPEGGATNLNPKIVGPWYERNWLIIEGGIYRDESCDLLLEYMHKNKTKTKWVSHIESMEKMKESWRE
jgi:tRNA(adenine34) deaminase